MQVSESWRKFAVIIGTIFRWISARNYINNQSLIFMQVSESPPKFAVKIRTIFRWISTRSSINNRLTNLYASVREFAKIRSKHRVFSRFFSRCVWKWRGEGTRRLWTSETMGIGGRNGSLVIAQRRRRNGLCASLENIAGGIRVAQCSHYDRDTAIKPRARLDAASRSRRSIAGITLSAGSVAAAIWRDF